MAKGDVLQNNRTVFTDEKTGREVWQMTSWPECHCLATYMYLKAFTKDGKYLAFASDRTGVYELYRLTIETGETRQLTDRSKIGEDDKTITRYNVHPNGREVVFREGNGYSAIDLQSLEERQIAHSDDPNLKPTGSPTLSGDGTMLICRFVDANERQGFAHVPYEGGKLEKIYRLDIPNRNLSHTLGATAPGYALSFVILPDFQNDPNESRENRARAWKLDINTGKAEPFLVMPHGHRATHEYWGPDGRLYFHKKSTPNWTPTSISSIDINGEDFQDHFVSQDRKLGHSNISQDGKRIVSDVQDPTGNELYEINLETGKSEILCWPNSTLVDGVVGHVHPAYDFSGNHIIYTSDKSGKAAVFVVPLKQ